jgi:hypothetical protein
VAGFLFVFVVHGAGIRRATYLCREVTKEWKSGAALLLKSHFAFDLVFKATNTL